MKRTFLGLCLLTVLASAACGSPEDTLFENTSDSGQPDSASDAPAPEGSAGAGHDAAPDSQPDAPSDSDAAGKDSEPSEAATDSEPENDADPFPDSDVPDTDLPDTDPPDGDPADSDSPEADAFLEAEAPDTDAGCVSGGPALGSVGTVCCTPNDLACAGHAQKLVLYCNPVEMKWTALQSCNGNQLCDTASGPNHGSCQDPLPQCVGKNQGDKVCDGSKLLECGPDLITAATTDCPFACQAGACVGVCVPGSKDCNANVPRTCDQAGAWQPAAPCPYVCSAGSCTGTCVPGSKQCLGNTPQTCSADGQWQSASQCPFVCSAGECEGSCIPGTRQCSGNVAQVCDASGQWQQDAACQYVCSAGQCTGVCAPGDQRCTGLVPQTCSAAGQWQSASACSYVCSAGSCTGHCFPGSKKCNGLVPQTCNASGEWQDNQACQYVCASGGCTGSCSPGSRQCNGQTALVCNTLGSWVYEATCPFVCATGSCTGVCVPGSKKCEGDVLRTCQADGQWDSGTQCGGQTPKCYTNQCGPEARPYFMVVADTSGSMIQCTTPPTSFPETCSAVASAASPDNACGLRPTRMNDMKCALRNTVGSFGQVDFGLTSFKQILSYCGSSPYACTPYQVDGLMPEMANGCSVGAGCEVGTGVNAHGGLVRVGLPVTSSSGTQFLSWIDEDCGSGNEIVPAGPTPINGSLRDATTHLRLNSSTLQSTATPVHVILITDGGESCDGTEAENRAAQAAQELYVNGLNDGSGRHVKVYPIGLGTTAAQKAALDVIARMGQCGSTVDACASGVTALVAANEAELRQRLADILNANLP